ncbi:MAG: hypothetical protein PWP43_215 [Bacillota bacterium]|nr:hypothetical protein [Bacillota bacterium]
MKNTVDYLWAALAFGLVLLLRQPFAALLVRQGAVRHNYRSRPVSFPWGVLLVLALTAVYSLRSLVEGANLLLWQGLFASYGAGFLGLVDDLLGDTTAKGLDGHLRAFLQGRRLTSGLIKAAAGMLLAFVLGMGTNTWGALFISALNLALAMNAINLLDVRPGRAGKGYLLFFGLLFFSGYGEAARTVGLPLALALLAYLPLDLGEKAMLGDTGANALGVTLGLIISRDLPPLGQLLALLVLVALHALTVFYSLSTLITRLPPLAALDRLGRPRN